MKRKATMAAVMLLLLSGVALQAVTSAATEVSGRDRPTWYTVKQGVSTGGGYRLSGLAWQVDGAASGRGYRLLGPAGPMSSENGCCCTYLPCVLRDDQ